ncbi:transmembrane protein 26-like [Antedon mediterranea]|uniref:transmembrane protein 26-like n=1 Tax=Antedon mediterranea TaxID=105859 RepID=UPI003AF955DD
MAGSNSETSPRKTTEGSLSVFRGIFVRLLFTAHATLCVSKVAFFVEQPYIWFFMFLLVVLYIEFFVVILQRKEWNWYSITVLCHLLIIIPVLWILELNFLESRLAIRLSDDDDCGLVDDESVDNKTIAFIAVFGLENNGENWSLILQQLLIIVLIVGHWILPRGEMTNNEHSQLLLVYVGSGADLLEFSVEGLRLDEIQCNTSTIYAILVIWTCGLLQFTMPLTRTSAPAEEHNGEFACAKYRPKLCRICVDKFWGTEIWAILVIMLFQDGPFLGVRLYLLFYKQVANEFLIFFTCKNIITIVLQLKRIRILLNKRLNKIVDKVVIGYMVKII